ncbi:MAG: hypothetical protein DRI61_12365 [Chloroflexi bacterium]|nr:MAG: hypothetical protein DRI61_12365 [Chloroflexota bacterium]
MVLVLNQIQWFQMFHLHQLLHFLLHEQIHQAVVLHDQLLLQSLLYLFLLVHMLYLDLMNP